MSPDQAKAIIKAEIEFQFHNAEWNNFDTPSKLSEAYNVMFNGATYVEHAPDGVKWVVRGVVTP